MIGDKTFMMTKGPSHLRTNIGLVTKLFKFLASNQTLSPFLKEVNFY